MLRSTAIPSIIHQTWWSTKADDFSVKSLEGIEKWLGYATQLNTNMAYFMWTDNSVKKLIMSVDQGFKYGGERVPITDILPKPVEIADVFRMVVCNTIGGVVSLLQTIMVDMLTIYHSMRILTQFLYVRRQTGCLPVILQNGQIL